MGKDELLLISDGTFRSRGTRDPVSRAKSLLFPVYKFLLLLVRGWRRRGWCEDRTKRRRRSGRRTKGPAKEGAGIKINTLALNE